MWTVWITARGLNVLCFFLLVFCPCYRTSEKTDPGSGHWVVLRVCHLQVSNVVPRQEAQTTLMKCLIYRTTPFHTSPLCCAEDLFTSRSGYTCGESCETKEMTWNSMLWPQCERGCSHDLSLSFPSFLSLFSLVSDRLFSGNKIKCKYLQ